MVHRYSPALAQGKMCGLLEWSTQKTTYYKYTNLSRILLHNPLHTLQVIKEQLNIKSLVQNRNELL